MIMKTQKQKTTAVLFLFFLSSVVKAQELYVYTEPASNMPAHSLSAKVTANYIGKRPETGNRFMQRYIPELMFGINKNWMVHAGGTFADMHTRNFRWESSTCLSKLSSSKTYKAMIKKMAMLTAMPPMLMIEKNLLFRRLRMPILK